MLLNLMSSRRFAPLFWAQFFSALNDNFLKNALVILILFGAATGGHSDSLVTVAGAVFIFPFFVLSALGGELADKYVKATIAKRVKFAEIFAACFAAAGFFLHSIPLLFVALGLFGIVAALFGPVKYGILPDQLETGELATGNALVEEQPSSPSWAAPSAAECSWRNLPIPDGFLEQSSFSRSHAGFLPDKSRSRLPQLRTLSSPAIR